MKTEALMMLAIMLSCWGGGSWFLMKLNSCVVGWIVAVTMLIVHTCALLRLCSLI